MTNKTLTHKIRLDPTKKQEIYFSKACGIARFTWNWALSEWKKEYDEGSKATGLGLKKEFNALKETHYPWIYEVTKYASQQPFFHLQKAFNGFFRKESRFPRFKKKGIHDSFYIGNDQIRLKDKSIKIPKLGWVRMRESLRFIGKVVSATVSRIADKWFVSINVILDQFQQFCENQAKVGIDLGIKKLATIYDGKKMLEIEGPKPLRKLLKKLARLQRCLSSKQKCSKNRNKQRLKVARLHYKISCIRQDFMHKLTTFLTSNYTYIAIEDLNVKGMMANHKLARNIADMGFYEFRRQLNYKAELKKNHIEVVDRWYPSSKKCSACGVVKKEFALKERLFLCDSCGFAIDRDCNAAINLFSTVSSTGFQVCGEKGSGSN